MADISKHAIWRATGKCKDEDLAKDVHRITLEERDRGWLKGTFSLSEPPVGAILTQRFGVKQSTTLSDGSRTYKTRPIDDFSESLVNSTNSMDETIQPMGIDMVLAALALRFRSWGPEELQGKTIDLRKACKTCPYLRVPSTTPSSVSWTRTRQNLKRFRARYFPLVPEQRSWGFAWCLLRCG